MPPWVTATGFKLFYEHCRFKNTAPVWTLLQKQEDLRVVHLKRRNVLRSHLSLKKAKQRDRWLEVEDGGSDRTTVRLDADECERVFAETRAQEREMDILFGDHPKLELWYEDLSERYPQQMGRVCDFLGLGPPARTPPIRKQAGMRLCESIENYAELERRFRATEWQSFFEE
jgi:LPS sulfotransferase NodH